MNLGQPEELPEYVREAIIKFSGFMPPCEKGVYENMNRANKGELFVLQYISSRNSAVLPSEISAAMGSSSARISALLGSLEKKGQIERDIHRDNRRNILATITETGRKRVAVEIGKLKEELALVFSEMGEDDVFEFLRLTERFFELMKKNKQP